MIKRLFDVFTSLFLLIILGPFFLILALLIKLSSKGPVFYRAERMGKDSQPFLMFKFRTMVIDADKKGKTFITLSNQDITWLGVYLRILKLDELPQLLNVLLGDMSMVGPRPEIPSIVRSCYNLTQMKVLSVKPGLTCITQVRHFPDLSYLTPAHVDSEQFYKQVLLPKKLNEDLAYIEQQSLRFDLILIAQTIGVILKKGVPLVFKKLRLTASHR